MSALQLALAIAPPLVGLATLAAGYYYYRQANRRNQLRISVVSQSLLGDDPSQLRQVLTVRSNDQMVENPYFVTVSLTNDGPKDIRSTDFENGKPLRIQLPGMIAARLPIDDPICETTGGEIHVSPGLLPKGKTFTIKVIADIPGPHPDESSSAIVSQLANTDIVTKAQVQ